MTTREVVNGKSVLQNLEFADYGFHGDSCRDYARLVTNGAPYHSARDQYQKDRDLPALIAAVARAYATDPNCAHLATVIASQRNVKQAVAEANRQESTRAPHQAQSDTSARRSEHINKTCRERASGTQECGGDVPDYLLAPFAARQCCRGTLKRSWNAASILTISRSSICSPALSNVRILCSNKSLLATSQ